MEIRATERSCLHITGWLNTPAEFFFNRLSVCPYLPQEKHRSILVSISKYLQFRVRACFLKVLKLQRNLLSSLKCVHSIAGTIAESIWNQCDREWSPQSKKKLYTCWWLSFASTHPERLSSVFSQSSGVGQENHRFKTAPHLLPKLITAWFNKYII